MHATTPQSNAAQGDMNASRSANSTLIERVAPQPAERAPISMAPIERVRSTSATQRRIENMQKLIQRTVDPRNAGRRNRLVPQVFAVRRP